MVVGANLPKNISTLIRIESFDLASWLTAQRQRAVLIVGRRCLKLALCIYTDVYISYL